MPASQAGRRRFESGRPLSKAVSVGLTMGRHIVGGKVSGQLEPDFFAAHFTFLLGKAAARAPTSAILVLESVLHDN